VIDVSLPAGHVWLRLTRPHYDDPFDTSHARRRGGRWNPPGSWPTLYLNEDMPTVHAQVRHMFVGRGVEADDLDDNAPIVLAAATLPQRQRAVEAFTDVGVDAIGLPPGYPLDDDGVIVDHDVTQPIGTAVHDAGFRGVWCRSAALHGHELAWFPADRAAARPVWAQPKPFGSWRHDPTLPDIR